MVLLKTDFLKYNLKHILNYKIYFLIFLLLFLSCLVSSCTNISNNINIFTILENIEENTVPQLISFLKALAYLMGFFFCAKSVLQFKEYGESRTMMSASHSLKKPVASGIVGIGLLYLPTTLTVAMNTVFNYSSPLSYSESGIDSQLNDIIPVVGGLIQLVGLIAFIRGIVLISSYAEHGGGPSGTSLGKALTHMLGGICAINIYGVWDILANTVGV